MKAAAGAGFKEWNPKQNAQDPTARLTTDCSGARAAQFLYPLSMPLPAPAESERWAPVAQPPMSEVVFASGWRRCILPSRSTVARRRRPSPHARAGAAPSGRLWPLPRASVLSRRRSWQGGHLGSSSERPRGGWRKHGNRAHLLSGAGGVSGQRRGRKVC